MSSFMLSLARSVNRCFLGGLLALLAACSSGLERDLPEVATQAAQTLLIPVASSADDVEGGRSVVTNSAALDFAQNRQTVGLRFAGVRIPPGARINWANISFTASAPDAAPVNLRIHGLDVDTAPALRSFGGARTSASALWQPRPWAVGAATRTSDLRAVVQEVVSRGGWRSGNALAFFVTGDRNAKRSAYAYDKGRAYAPVLSVSYTTAGTPTTPAPSTPASPSGSCLSRGRGPLMTLTGNYPSSVHVTKKTGGVRVDARNARLLATAPNVLLATNLNAGSFCLHGGVYDVAGLTDTTPWSTFVGAHGLLFYGTPNAVVENLTVLEVGDGISFKNDNPNWTFRNSYIRHAGDDGVENDRFNAGTVDDVLIDWAYTGISCRYEEARVAPRNVPFTVRNTLIALRPQVGTYKVAATSKPAHGELFKVTKNSTTGCQLILQDNVFLITTPAGYVNPNDDPNVGYDMLDTAACAGRKNTIVFVGTDIYYLNRLRALDPACFTVTTDVNVWRAARSRWFDRHPQFESFRNAEPVGENYQ